MKKALAVLVAVMMMATVCMTASAGAVNMAFASVSVEEGTATVDVPLNVVSSEGIFGFIVNVTYDPAVLEFSKATKGDAFNVLSNAIAEDTVKLVIDAAEVADVTAAGVAATLTFNVKGAAGASSDIVAVLPDPDSNINVDGDNVNLTVANGAVSVVAKPEPSAPVTEPSKPEPSKTNPIVTDPAPSNNPAPVATTASTTAAPAATTAATPSTGSMIPAAAIVLASASAAVLCFARKK